MTPSSDDPVPGGDPSAEPSELDGIHVVSLADVKPKEVSWLWPDRIPLGTLTLLDGDPGLGKSTLTLDLAARVTRDGEMPDGGVPDLDGPAGVVLLTAEDGLGDTIRPRLDAAGADASRVKALQGVDDEAGNERLPTLGDVDQIRSVIRSCHARLLIVDPLTAYMGSRTDTHRDAAVRGALAGLAQLADEMGVAVLAIRHLNKSEDAKALYRGGGSIAFTASARSVLLVAKNPDDPSGEGRVLAQLKANLARQQESLAFHLQEDDGGAVTIAWDGRSPHDPAGLLRESSTADVSPRDQAKKWLRSELAAGPVPATRVKQRAESFGITPRTLRRAKEDLGIKSDKEDFDDSQWWWELPERENRNHAAGSNDGTREPPQDHDVATFGNEDGENPHRAAPSAKDAKQGGDGTLREPANDANSDESGSLREHPNGSGVLSDRTAEDGHDSEWDPRHRPDEDLDGRESGALNHNQSTQTSTVPVEMVDGEYW